MKKKPRTSAIYALRSGEVSFFFGRDTKPEMRVRRALHAAGLRYRLHAERLPGRPDLIFPSRRVAVFVHGCIWHRHPDPDCKLARLPKSRLDFWVPKLEGNRARDERNRDEFEKMGWIVLEVWECSTSCPELAALAKRIKALRVRK